MVYVQNPVGLFQVPLVGTKDNPVYYMGIGELYKSTLSISYSDMSVAFAPIIFKYIWDKKSRFYISNDTQYCLIDVRISKMDFIFEPESENPYVFKFEIKRLQTL